MASPISMELRQNEIQLYFRKARCIRELGDQKLHGLFADTFPNFPIKDTTSSRSVKEDCYWKFYDKSISSNFTGQHWHSLELIDQDAITSTTDFDSHLLFCGRRLRKE